MIRIAKAIDFKNLIPLYKSFFPVHNVFQQPDSKVLAYLKKQAQENELLIFDESGDIKGAVFLAMQTQTPNGDHILWKLRHFAYESDNIAYELLAEAEKKIKEASRTAKIELTLAENEKSIKFYKSKGYTEEGSLNNHYRWGETCHILGKSISK